MVETETVIVTQLIAIIDLTVCTKIIICTAFVYVQNIKQYRRYYKNDIQ